MPSAQASQPRERRSPRVFLSLLVFVLAPVSWYWTIDQPFLRATGLTAWLGLALALYLALSAARVDRRGWVRAVAGLQLALVALFTWAYFVAARLPETRAASLSTAPDFTLPDHLGRSVHLADELASGPVLLVFFRGHW